MTSKDRRSRLNRDRCPPTTDVHDERFDARLSHADGKQRFPPGHFVMKKAR